HLAAHGGDPAVVRDQALIDLRLARGHVEARAGAGERAGQEHARQARGVLFGRDRIRELGELGAQELELVAGQAGQRAILVDRRGVAWAGIPLRLAAVLARRAARDARGAEAARGAIIAARARTTAGSLATSTRVPAGARLGLAFRVIPA